MNLILLTVALFCNTFVAARALSSTCRKIGQNLQTEKLETDNLWNG